MSIDAIVASAEGSLQTKTPEQIAEIALQLARASSHIADLLGPMKDALREHANERREPEDSSVIIEGGTEGKVMVTFPTTQNKLAKSFDVDVALETLGNRFGVYFDTKVTYTPRKNLTAMVKTASEQSEQDFVMRCIERHEPTPRVSFKK